MSPAGPCRLRETGRVRGTLPSCGLEAVDAAVCLTSPTQGKERGLEAAVVAMIYEILVVPCTRARTTAFSEGAWPCRGMWLGKERGCLQRGGLESACLL